MSKDNIFYKDSVVSASLLSFSDNYIQIFASFNTAQVQLFLSLQTYIGPVVVSVNPYRLLSIYTPDYIEEYTSRNMYELPPHM